MTFGSQAGTDEAGTVVSPVYPGDLGHFDKEAISNHPAHGVIVQLLDELESMHDD